MEHSCRNVQDRFDSRITKRHMAIVLDFMVLETSDKSLVRYGFAKDENITRILSTSHLQIYTSETLFNFGPILKL